MAEHSTITSANCHEPKHISTSTTADTGKVITPSSTVNGTSELRKITVEEINPAGQTLWAGWQRSEDTTYTSGSPLAINPAARTQITIDGNGSGTTVAYSPSGSGTFWDVSTNKIIPDNEGDGYLARITFKAKTLTASSYFDIDLDIGGGLGVILNQTKVFAKGTGVEHSFVITWPLFTLATFVANGGTLNITPSSNDQTFYDFAITIFKTYSGA